MAIYFDASSECQFPLVYYLNESWKRGVHPGVMFAELTGKLPVVTWKMGTVTLIDGSWKFLLILFNYK
jgi:hypothetical protein